jgi:hypothetical protein
VAVTGSGGPAQRARADGPFPDPGSRGRHGTGSGRRSTHGSGRVRSRFRQGSVVEERSRTLSMEAPGTRGRFQVTGRRTGGPPRLTRLIPERSHHIDRHCGAGSCCSPRARVICNQHSTAVRFRRLVFALARLTLPPPRTFGRAGEVRLRNDEVGMASPLASPCARGIFFAGSSAVFV